MAQSDNSQCLPGQLTAHERFLLPFPRPGRNIRRNQFAVRGKNHRNHFLRNRIRVRSRRVHHINVFPAGVFDVDIVVSRSRSDHQFQRGKKIHDLRRDFLAADNHRFRIRVRLRQIRKRRFHVLNDCEAFRGKNFGNNFIKFCRNQHFFHNGTSFLLFVVSSYKLLPKLPSCKPLRSNFAFFSKIVKEITESFSALCPREKSLLFPASLFRLLLRREFGEKDRQKDKARSDQSAAAEHLVPEQIRKQRGKNRFQ